MSYVYTPRFMSQYVYTPYPPKKNHEIRIWKYGIAGPMEYMVLKLHAIEITSHRPPNNRHWHDRDMVLYYGWSKPTNKYFWDTILKYNRHRNEFTPGYY